MSVRCVWNVNSFVFSYFKERYIINFKEKYVNIFQVKMCKQFKMVQKVKIKNKEK